MSTEMRELWEGFWRELSESSQEAFWDVPPEFTVARQWPLFERYFDESLPVVDLGCGNGTQTRFLAKHADKVIGVDIAESAVSTARINNPAPNVAYHQLDILDANAVTQLHDHTGDVNVYMRGVIHQLPVVTRLPALKSIATLTGRRGHVFNHEPLPAAYAIMNELLNQPGGPPPRLAYLVRHFRDGLRFATLDAPAAETMLLAAGFQIVAQGELAMHTADAHGGARLDLPSTYVIARTTGKDL